MNQVRFLQARRVQALRASHALGASALLQEEAGKLLFAGRERPIVIQALLPLALPWVRIPNDWLLFRETCRFASAKDIRRLTFLPCFPSSDEAVEGRGARVTLDLLCDSSKIGRV